MSYWSIKVRRTGIVLLLSLTYSIGISQSYIVQKVSEPVFVVGRISVSVGDSLITGLASNIKEGNYFNNIYDKHSLESKTQNDFPVGSKIKVIGLLMTSGIDVQLKYEALAMLKKDTIAIDLHEAVMANEITGVNQHTFIGWKLDKQKTGQEIFTQFDNSVVKVSVTNSQGSGVIVSSSGYIITNYHVVGENTIVTVTGKSPRKPLRGRVVYKNSQRDLAVCKVEGSDFQPAPFNTSPMTHIGMEVYAIGSPFGYQNLLTKGIISGWATETDGYPYVIHDAAISSGNSGGALVNSKGELIGINVRARQQDFQNFQSIVQNINFAIPTTEIFKLLKTDNLERIVEKVILY